MVKRQKRTPPDRLDEFLSVGEAAAFLGVSASTLRNWDRDGRLEARRHPLNRYRLYRREDLVKLLAALQDEPRKRND